MPDLFAIGAAKLASELKAHAASPVTYRRGAQFVSLSATVGQSSTEIDVGEGVREEFKSRDFLILAADLILGGVVVTPQRGDTIEMADGSVHRVFPPGKSAGANQTSEPGWRYSDLHNNMLRIHTKQVTRP